MRKVIKLLPTFLLVAGLTVSLGFGASEAVACTGCEQPDYVDCTQFKDPDLFCENLCVNFQGCLKGGQCAGAMVGCVCFE